MLVNGGSRIARIMLCLSLLFFVMVSNSWCAQEDYNGLYKGTYSGDDNGVLYIAIDINLGAKFWFYSTDISQGDIGPSSSINYEGEAGTVGNYSVGPSYFWGYQFAIEVDSFNGSVTGTWSDTDSADSGTLIGTKITSDDFIDQYVGTYKGTYIGDNSGKIVISIKSNGEIVGDITGSVTIDGADYAFKQGWLHPDGYFHDDGDGPNDEEFAFWGKINGVSMSGWWYSVTGDTGTFNATISNDDGGGGGGGGGGCFIDALNQ